MQPALNNLPTKEEKKLCLFPSIQCPNPQCSKFNGRAVCGFW